MSSLAARPSGRSVDQLRAVELTVDVNRYAEGSCLVKFGNTHVLCTATLEEKAPSFLKGSGKGWVTAEYGMLPRSTHTRTDREAAKGKQSGRTQEIQRLIGRSLRASCDLAALGERQVVIDCDVLQADGGTRTAAVTGGYVPLGIALRRMRREKALRAPVAAVSVGIIAGEIRLDLDYEEDFAAEVDFNVVANAAGELLEVQGTAEKKAFTPEQLFTMVALAQKGARELHVVQRAALDHAAAADRPTRG